MASVEEWIAQQLAMGTPKEQVVQSLISAGYDASIRWSVDKYYDAKPADTKPARPVVRYLLIAFALAAIVAVAGIAFIMMPEEAEIENIPLEPQTPEVKVYTLSDKKPFLIQYTHIEHYAGALAGINENTFSLEKNGTRIDVEAEAEVRIINRKESRVIKASELEIGSKIEIYTERNADRETSFTIIVS